MPRRIDRQRAIELYTVQHLTMAEIGAIFGVSRTAVCKALQASGIASTDGERVHCTCAQCHAPLIRSRRRWRKSQKHYCNRACYARSRMHATAVLSRAGTMTARRIVAQYFLLKRGHIVHHHDHNERNNAITNLAVLASQRDHIRLHHGHTVPFLWDGRAGENPGYFPHGRRAFASTISNT